MEEWMEVDQGLTPSACNQGTQSASRACSFISIQEQLGNLWLFMNNLHSSLYAAEFPYSNISEELTDFSLNPVIVLSVLSVLSSMWTLWTLRGHMSCLGCEWGLFAVIICAARVFFTNSWCWASSNFPCGGKHTTPSESPVFIRCLSLLNCCYLNIKHTNVDLWVKGKVEKNIQEWWEVKRGGRAPLTWNSWESEPQVELKCDYKVKKEWGANHTTV